MRIVVFGAGAVGSTLGGLLALKHHDVLLVCRKHHSDSIKKQQGLRMKSGTGDYFADLRSTEKLSKEELGEDACILFTPKSNDTKSCVKELSKAAPAKTPIIGFQNGIANEEIIAETFSHVYGGVCKMTCSFLQPGHVSFRRIGSVAVGKYPKGKDAFTKRFVGILSEAGFRSALSEQITCDKWLKLAVNLQSTIHAIIDSIDHNSPEFASLKMGLIEEAVKVFRAHKIKSKSCDSRDLSIEEIISELKKPKAARIGSTVRVQNSTWQSLYLKRKEIENAYFHGPIIQMAREHGIDVPFNEVALEMVTDCHKRKLGPEALRVEDVLAAVKKRASKKGRASKK